MENNMDKSLFFMTLSYLCIWLVVDFAIGKNYLGNFLTILFPFMGKDSSTKTTKTTKQVETAKNNAPTSSAIGSNKESKPISGVPYGATRK